MTSDPGDCTVGQHVRGARLLKSLTLRQLADLAECSESLLSKVENGHASPSLAMLQRIARALEVPVASLVTPIDPLHVARRADERMAIRIDAAGSCVEALVPDDGEHLLEAHLHTLLPGAGSGAEPIAHQGEEVGYVIEGRLELIVGSRTYVLNAGDSFNFRSEIPHRYRNPGRKPVRVLWVSTPSRRSNHPGARVRARRKRA